MSEYNGVPFGNNYNNSFDVDFSETGLDISLFDRTSIGVMPVKHNDLIDRDKSNAHPLEAITGMSDVIARIDELETKVDIATISEIREYIS